MEVSVKQKIAAGATSLWCVVLFLLVFGQTVDAAVNSSSDSNGQSVAKSDANDPNELWWRKWDAVIKDPNDPNELLDTKWDAIITVLQNKELEQELKDRIIDKIMTPIFDSELMAKLALGKTNWAKLTATQQKKFTELFTKHLKSFYLEKTLLYDNEKVLFKPAVRKNDLVQIPMSLVSKNKETAMLYKLRKATTAGADKVNGYWKIYDVEIEGISVIMTYQSQFDDILRRGSVDDLFSQLEKPPTK